MALEPHVRRIWPHVLISTSRLVQGRFRDPLVGRDLLIGGLVGIFATTLWRLDYFVRDFLGLDLPSQLNPDVLTLAGFAELVGEFAESIAGPLMDVFFYDFDFDRL